MTTPIPHRPARNIRVPNGRPRALALALLLLAGCGSGPAAPPGRDAPGPGAGTELERAGFGTFPDIALPAGTSIDLDRSLVLGTGRDWVGRLAFTANGNLAAAYDFFRTEMPKLGWTEMTSLRGATSLLVFQQGARVVSIQIVGRSFALSGVAVELVMAPRAAGGAGSGAGSGGGRGAIDLSPLPRP